MEEMKALEVLSDELNEQFAKWRAINRWFDRVLLLILLFLVAFIGSALMENWMLTIKGMDSVRYNEFDELLAVNPDTVAWITIDGTNIDYPVVQGKDNFEYLDKAFTGEFSVGGTLFLDSACSGDFSERYSIIYGHHMAGGKMFGDLKKFRDGDFLAKNHRGVLLTPEWDYDLDIIAAGRYDAYDADVYTVGDRVPADRILAAGSKRIENRAAPDEVHTVVFIEE